MSEADQCESMEFKEMGPMTGQPPLLALMVPVASSVKTSSTVGPKTFSNPSPTKKLQGIFHVKVPCCQGFGHTK